MSLVDLFFLIWIFKMGFDFVVCILLVFNMKELNLFFMDFVFEIVKILCFIR